MNWSGEQVVWSEPTPLVDSVILRFAIGVRDSVSYPGISHAWWCAEWDGIYSKVCAEWQLSRSLHGSQIPCRGCFGTSLQGKWYTPSTTLSTLSHWCCASPYKSIALSQLTEFLPNQNRPNRSVSDSTKFIPCRFRLYWVVWLLIEGQNSSHHDVKAPIAALLSFRKLLSRIAFFIYSC